MHFIFTQNVVGYTYRVVEANFEMNKFNLSDILYTNNWFKNLCGYEAMVIYVFYVDPTLNNSHSSK